MARRNQPLLRALLDCPWWVSVLLSAFTYFAMTTLLPALIPHSGNAIAQPLHDGISKGLSMAAPIASIVLLLPAPFSFFKSYKLRQNYQVTSTRDDIASLNWIEFEGLIGEYYRQQGYKVKQNLDYSPDGGVDIELSKDGKVSLVQCKHWKARKVGVKVLRELYGVLLDQQAEKMIVVTSGEFTIEAQRFALNKRFELIQGSSVLQLLHQSKQAATSTNSLLKKPESTTAQTKAHEQRICPQCNSPLVLRTATRGANAGKEFYGCSGFPRCRYTVSKLLRANLE